MAFKIRRANESDQAAIKRLVRTANINPLGIAWQRFLVAEDAGRMVGIGQVKLHGDGSRELASMATVPDRQGEGIATAIIEALLATEEGTLYLTCREHMASFYERFGFRRIMHQAAMPAYFRRIMRAGNLLFALARLFGHRDGGLVMVRERE